jgi:hypothetical protein
LHCNSGVWSHVKWRAASLPFQRARDPEVRRCVLEGHEAGAACRLPGERNYEVVVFQENDSCKTQ